MTSARSRGQGTRPGGPDPLNLQVALFAAEPGPLSQDTAGLDEALKHTTHIHGGEDFLTKGRTLEQGW